MEGQVTHTLSRRGIRRAPAVIIFCRTFRFPPLRQAMGR